MVLPIKFYHENFERVKDNRAGFSLIGGPSQTYVVHDTDQRSWPRLSGMEHPVSRTDSKIQANSHKLLI